MPDYVVTIAGSDKTSQIDSLTISDPANGRGTMQFNVLSEDGTYVPAIDDEVICTEAGVRIFGGHIHGVFERGFGGAGGTAILTEVSAVDFNALTSRRYFSGTIPAGTLKAGLTQILPYIPGVTLHASQVDGPVFPELVYEAWKIEDILNQFSSMTEGTYVWKVDYSKVLRAYTPGSVAAPFTITAGDGVTVFDVSSEPTRTNYANRILVYGTGVFATAEDPIATTNPWELIVRVPDITTQGRADAIAETALAVSLAASVKHVTYGTHDAGLFAGMSQSMTLPSRHINNTFLLTDVRTRVVAGVGLRTVTAVEGSLYQRGWREDIKEWGGAGGGVTVGGSGGIPSGATIFAYPMGGSKLEPVRGTGTSWEFVGEQVQLDTALLGTNVVAVNLRLSTRDAGVGVKARLYDVTNSVACAGESSTVTSTTPQFVSFSATLTPGTYIYQTQAQVNTADRDASAEGIYASPI